eukprot:TRINITY_DN2500_c0_g1_i6.p1 TRINITY_DN2500_c0_g1~~TRINITY_DN2500_c0_g1_i6.p1  ORF type:complete len:161 (+),score=35.82 TRINITY_DN2500_c0_g1_i6:436-918(+)
MALIATLEGHEDFVTSLALNINGTILASGAYDGQIKLWNIETLSELTTLEQFESPVNSIAFNDNKSILAIGAQNNRIKFVRMQKLDEGRKQLCDEKQNNEQYETCLLYTSDAADEEDSVDLGGRRILKKKKEKNKTRREPDIRKQLIREKQRAKDREIER